MEEDSCVLVPTNWGVGVQARVGPHGITALLLRCTRTGADLFHLSRTATCSCPLRLVFVREDDGVIKLHIECSITIPKRGIEGYRYWNPKKTPSTGGGSDGCTTTLISNHDTKLAILSTRFLG